MHWQRGMGLELAEPCRELLMLHRRDMLVAEEQHLVLQPQLADLARQGVVPCNVSDANIREFRANRRSAEFDLDRMLQDRTSDDRRSLADRVRNAELRHGFLPNGFRAPNGGWHTGFV